MHKILIIVIIFSSLGFSQLGKNVRIVREDSRSLTLEFTPSFSTQKLKGANGEELQRIAFTGEVIDRQVPGVPWISYVGVPLQLPGSHYSLSVVNTEFRTMDGIRPIAFPKMIADKKFGFSPAFEAHTTEKVRQHPLVEMADLVSTQGKFVGTLKFYPIEYNESAGNAKLYTRIVVRIDFDPWPLSTVSTSAPTQASVRHPAASSITVSRQKVSGDSPLSQGTWYKMAVKETGIYRIDQTLLQQANISLASVGNIQSIRIFGNGGTMLPENLAQSRPNGLEEVARYVVDNNGNGQFDSDDYVLFYGCSTRGWNYDPASKSYNHFINFYSELNYYFLTFGGAQGVPMDTVVSTNYTGLFSPEDFQEKILLKQERFNLVGSGRQWVGQSFDIIDNSAVYVNSLPGFVSSQPVQYRFVFLSRSSSIDTFSVYEHGLLIGAPVLTYTVNVDPGANEFDYAHVTPRVSFTSSGLISDGRSVVRIAFGTKNQGAKGWIDYVDLFYRRAFEASGDALLFDSPDTTAIIEYAVKNLSSTNVFVFDVSNHKAVKRITQVRTDPAKSDVRVFQSAQTGGGVGHFAVVGFSGTKSPSGITRITNSNLHGQSPGAEFIIVAPSEFVPQAQQLSSHRQAHDSLKTTVAVINDIYNEFSGGLLDPMAIRDFFRYAVKNWTIPPKYVLLLGNGHYDYKNITTASPNWIPPYETMESIFQINSIASDDFFVFLDTVVVAGPSTVNSPRITIPIGRIPARTAAEASSMVSKIIDYETNSPFDTWRNRITFVGDDGLTSTGDDGSIHTAQAEDLADNHTPATFERRKIYLSMYPTMLSATGRRKPDVNTAIVAAINRGTLVLNFSGHGNTTLWAHEAIFTRDQDIPQLVNRDKLVFLVAATCNFAEYDDPLDQSAGELILVMDKGGAVAEVTSSRAVYQYDNQQFNNLLYDYLFQRDGQGNPRRLGDASWLTKQVLYGVNDVKYHLLGDPTMRLNVPRSSVTLDSINGNSTSQLVTMKSLGIVTVTGDIKDVNGTHWSTFAGRGVLEVFDSQRQQLLADIGNYPVEVIGSILYRGEVSITNGIYRATFPIPKDVTYGSRSRLSFYGWNSSTDAVGYTENVTINGTDSTAAADTTGPHVEIYFDDESFRAGDRVKPNPTLIVNLQSRNGINTSTAGIGHRLEAVLNKTTSIDLTDYYRGDLDTYQSGQIRYAMTNLADGKYSLVVKAWDIRNFATQSETYFEVSSANDLEMTNVVNYPNPFSQSTTFTFQRNSQDPIDVEVRIYTVAGRLIQILRAYALTDRFVQIPWDGKDRDGDGIANGVYLYKILAMTVDRRSTKEEFGKFVIMR